MMGYRHVQNIAILEFLLVSFDFFATSPPNLPNYEQAIRTLLSPSTPPSAHHHHHHHHHSQAHYPGLYIIMSIAIGASFNDLV